MIRWRFPTSLYDWAKSIPFIEKLAPSASKVGQLFALAILIGDASNDVHEAARRTLEVRFPFLGGLVAELASEVEVESTRNAREYMAHNMDRVFLEKRHAVSMKLISWLNENFSNIAWNQEALQFENSEDQGESSLGAYAVSPEVLAFMTLARLLSEKVEQRIAGGGGRGIGVAGLSPDFPRWTFLLNEQPEFLLEPEIASKLWVTATKGLSRRQGACVLLACLRCSDSGVFQLGKTLLEKEYGVLDDAMPTPYLVVQKNETSLGLKEVKVDSSSLPSQREQIFLRARTALFATEHG